MNTAPPIDRKLDSRFAKHGPAHQKKTQFPPGIPGSSEVKASACNAGDPALIPVLGQSPREANGNPLQYSCLENPMDGGAW